MIEAIDTISKVWPVIISLIGLVAWLVRLESSLSNAKDRIDSNNTSVVEKLARLQAEHDVLNSEVMKKISEMSDKLSRIEGAMGVHK